MKAPQDIILKPVITEKSMDGLQEGKYTFKVAKDATKPEIKKAVEKLFGFSIMVSDTTVPFCSMSSRFTRQQLYICCT